MSDTGLHKPLTGRSAGILLHVTALPGRFPVGTLGDDARAFVDFLAEAGQRVWQVLPLGVADTYHSPYQSASAFAGNPLLIDPGMLHRAGLIGESTLSQYINSTEPNGSVEFSGVARGMERVLREAFRNRPDGAAEAFAIRHPWAGDFARFMAYRGQFGNQSWQHWPAGLAHRDPEAMAAMDEGLWEEIHYHLFCQQLFYEQMAALRAYAASKNVAIMGDMPLYLSGDSADVWANPGQFELSAEGFPLRQAGVPPDAFSEDGQLWGNPLYHWERHRADDFAFWRARIRHAAEWYDALRIDHFRGLESFWAIPAGAKTAQDGSWERGPGIDLLTAIRQELHAGGLELTLLAEDLGIITDEVRRLRRDAGMPGMKVLQFAFDGNPDNEHLPGRFADENLVVYTGTHDNDTTHGWAASLPDWQREVVRRTLSLGDDREIPGGVIRAALLSDAALCIIPMQDYLGLTGEARFNTPGTVGQNWVWRMAGGLITDHLAEEIRRGTRDSGRL